MIQKTKIANHTGDSGKLSVIDFKEIPFIPKRSFYITNVPVGTIRGNHAHKEAKQWLVCTEGQIEVIFRWPHFGDSVILRRDEAVLVDNMVWSRQTYLMQGSSLLVFASTEYDPEDYISEYNDYCHYVWEQHEKKQSVNNDDIIVPKNGEEYLIKIIGVGNEHEYWYADEVGKEYKCVYQDNVPKFGVGWKTEVFSIILKKEGNHTAAKSIRKEDCIILKKV